MHHVLVGPEHWSGEPGILAIEGEEARHAIRVKRLKQGERVGVLDGAGRRGVGAVSVIAGNRRSFELDVDQVTIEPPVEPRLEIWAAAPKGDRLETMVDHLSQAGATAWVPITSDLTERELTEKRAERLERVADESLKQCGRAWKLEIASPRPASEAWADQGALVLVADATGGAMPECPAAGTVRVVVGPEGGWTASELEAASAAGATRVGLGPHVMRIGTAAVVAAGVVRAASVG
ncbi:MAG: RsmE family RNA methyltransferase [Planctomycetota bacterium]